MKQNKRVIMASTSDLAAAITDGMQRFGCRNNFNLINKGSEDSPNWIAVEKIARGNAGMETYEARINVKNAAQRRRRPSIVGGLI
ncbi:hypothetical protein CN503_05780 [Bacillus cereus]|uniref:hypothetical protein n=1 Tax=Bacillus cereus TaxID=1396 RepID=UPI000BEDF074|nr:hypothetical protein [Bacillus cereus]EKS7872321.1 hypothetical protein [Bacillus cereus]MDF9472133.1 hypothetical protein [Bacillus cereus]PED90960.1 hypothetical protein CON43_02770 [Bacillus cereus]PER69652.1 hypothetical protein CN503_05780 [Bacillus cereus]